MKITLHNVAQVYSGKQGKCCCGCAGKHTYSPDHREFAPDYVQTANDAEDFSQRTVKLIVGKMEKLTNLDEKYVEFVRDDYVSVVSESGERIYVAYFAKPDPEFAKKYGHLDRDARKRAAAEAAEHEAERTEVEWAKTASLNW